MRIPKSWVPFISKRIIENLISKELISSNIPIEKLILQAEEIILDELMVEDRLNEEVKEILKSHAYEIEKGKLDYRKLFELTKQKLVKERNLIL
jgi:hypothetical protein